MKSDDTIGTAHSADADDVDLRIAAPICAARDGDLELAREIRVVRIAIEKLIVDRKTGKPLPKLKWLFTGSVMKQPDPDKPDKVYGADFTGTLIAIFPVTDETVLQTNLTMKEEPLLKLDVNKSQLPAVGTAVKLILEAK